jgi:hypothetical protein
MKNDPGKKKAPSMYDAGRGITRSSYMSRALTDPAGLAAENDRLRKIGAARGGSGGAHSPIGSIKTPVKSSGNLVGGTRAHMKAAKKMVRRGTGSGAIKKPKR